MHFCRWISAFQKRLPQSKSTVATLRYAKQDIRVVFRHFVQSTDLGDITALLWAQVRWCGNRWKHMKTADNELVTMAWSMVTVGNSFKRQGLYKLLEI